MAATVSTAMPYGDRALETGQIRVKNLGFVLLQLGLLLLVLRQFQIESGAFLRLAALAFAGFAVHAMLPLRYRLAFFLVLSLAGIALVLGVTDAAWLVAIGLGLIGICHLPIALRWRVALLLAVGAALAALRAQQDAGPLPQTIWPILGSMFMFRLIVYLYDLRHEKEPASAARTLSYFFMLPNVCFPLFPVIDYKTFRRNYFDADAYRTYQTGVEWMVRGVVHLLLYRYVYYYLTLSPAEVRNPGDLSQYLLSNFLLYLRVSGLFHMVIGMLYLFGFRLPETHNNYFLASSFTDFWRRINIYWKDFMLKVFYYPTVFRLRHMGTTTAMVLATLFVFFMTWFLHAYQWFWLRGTALLVWQDVLFWLILGLLVVGNALWEAKHGRRRSLGQRRFSWRAFSNVAVKVAVTFTVICVLWSFWTSESLESWGAMWGVLAPQTEASVEIPTVALLTALVLAAAAGAGGGGNPEDGSGRRSGAQPPARRRRWSSWLRPPVFTVGALLVLVAAGVEDVHRQLGQGTATVIHTLRSGSLSRLDQARLERGYYENLLDVNRFNSQLWEVYARRPANWLDVEFAGLKRFTGGFIENDLIPSFTSNTRYGSFTTNRWGMRDQEYDLAPPPDTFRIALLGASSVAGWGVEDGATFESLLEARLNAERAYGFARYEILNLSVPGYQPPQQLPRLQTALAFAPDAVMYVATGREPSNATRFLVETLRKRVEIPYPELHAALERAGVTPRTETSEALRLIGDARADILGWIYRHIADESRAHGAVPILVFLPQAQGGAWQEETPLTLQLAEEAGFVILDLSDIYEGEILADIVLAEWDLHPNAYGHRLIADALHGKIGEARGAIFGTDRTTQTTRDGTR